MKVVSRTVENGGVELSLACAVVARAEEQREITSSCHYNNIIAHISGALSVYYLVSSCNCKTDRPVLYYTIQFYHPLYYIMCVKRGSVLFHIILDASSGRFCTILFYNAAALYNLLYNPSSFVQYPIQSCIIQLYTLAAPYNLLYNPSGSVQYPVQFCIQ